MAFTLKHSKQNVWYGQFSLFECPDLVHGISTRLGGVGKAPYNTLNLAFHVEDDAVAVVANRKIFCAALGVDFNRLVTAQQVPVDRIVIVVASDCGKGPIDDASEIAVPVALIPAVNGVALLVAS